jgi:hypothetical protein
MCILKGFPTTPAKSASSDAFPFGMFFANADTLYVADEGNGTVAIWGVTSTVSGSGDRGADPNKLVAITDKLAATALPAGGQFVTVRSAGFGEVLRGVSLTPGTGH